MKTPDGTVKDDAGGPPTWSPDRDGGTSSERVHRQMRSKGMSSSSCVRGVGRSTRCGSAEGELRCTVSTAIVADVAGVTRMLIFRPSSVVTVRNPP